MRNIRPIARLVLAATGFALAACSSGGASRDLAPVTPVAPPAPVAPAVAAPVPIPPPGAVLSAAVITRVMSDRKFTYAMPGRKGTVTYFKDGTFDYDEAGKGPGTGIWQAGDGKLCEARNPTAFLPKGTPSTCSKITSDGTRLTAGTMQLTPL